MKKLLITLLSITIYQSSALACMGGDLLQVVHTSKEGKKVVVATYGLVDKELKAVNKKAGYSIVSVEAIAKTDSADGENNDDGHDHGHDHDHNDGEENKPVVKSTNLCTNAKCTLLKSVTNQDVVFTYKNAKGAVSKNVFKNLSLGENASIARGAGMAKDTKDELYLDASLCATKSE